MRRLRRTRSFSWGTATAAAFALVIVGRLAAAPPAERSADPATDPAANPAANPATDPVPTPAPGTDTTATPALDRLIRRFDFEEAEEVRVEFPLHFKRNISVDRGFPKFGTLSLTRETSASGNWSFQFALDGGSLSAEIPTGVLPVIPLADYVVTCRVRTSGLTHARARLLAQFHDATGNPITESAAESPLTRTGGVWKTLAIHIPGDYENAADLVVELQVLQPRQYGDHGADSGEPVLEDVSGFAWFDDLAIWHMPRIELTTDAPGNVYTAPATAHVGMLVRDLANESLNATLQVRDIEGNVVYEDRFLAPRGRLPLTKDLPLPRCGWYRAELSIRSGSTLAGRETLDLVVIPPDRPRDVRTAERLGVALPHVPISRLRHAAGLVRQLQVGGAIVTVWDEQMSEDLAEDRTAALRDMIEDLLVAETEVTFALEGVPHDLAGRLGVDPAQVLDLLSHDPSEWREHLDTLLINFGLRVSRWQLGSSTHPDAFWKPELPALTSAARTSLTEFISQATIVLPFTAYQEIPESIGQTAAHVTVPTAVAPADFADYAAPWRRGGRDLSVQFEVLPDRLFTPRQQVVDLMIRALHAWRLGVPRIFIEAPWRWPDDATGPQPDPAFAAWRGLADALRGRRFAGELPVGDGVIAWYMEDTDTGTGSLVLWRDEVADAPAAPVEVLLSEHPVRLVDAFGNTTTVTANKGTHSVPVTDLPIFVEGINLQLARFRAAFRIEPPFVPSMHRVHDAELVLENPWDIGISGSIRLRDVEGCEITPRRRDFAMLPHEEIRVPLNIVLDRSAVSGRRRVDADVRISANGTYRLTTHATLDVGWKDVELRPSWSVGHDARTGEPELLITHHITNRGESMVSVDAFVVAPGLRMDRRPVAALAPGATAIKTFRIPGDAASLAGRRIRVGVSERDGIAQLNQLLTIPQLVVARQ